MDWSEKLAFLHFKKKEMLRISLVSFFFFVQILLPPIKKLYEVSAELSFVLPRSHILSSLIPRITKNSPSYSIVDTTSSEWISPQAHPQEHSVGLVRVGPTWGSGVVVDKRGCISRPFLLFFFHCVCFDV